MIKDLENTLKESFIFGDFPAEEISRLAQICSTRKVSGGEKIFAEGDNGDSLFIVGKGGIRIYRMSSEAFPETLAILGPGGLFGEESFIGPKERNCSAVAIETSWIAELSRSDFNVIFSKQPSSALKVMKRLASIIATRVRAATDKVDDSITWAREIRNWAGWRLQELVGRPDQVEIAVKGQGRFTGRIIEIQDKETGCSILWESEEGRVHWTPFHALYYLRLAGTNQGMRRAEENRESQGLINRA